VVIVADAAPAVGMGHVSRCSALAAALSGPVRCLAFEAPEAFERDGVSWTPWTGELDELEADVAVIDGYRFDATRLAARLPVVLFHDGGEVPPGVALVIAPIAHGDGWLNGFEYACLRREFWEREPHQGGAGVLVTTGAGPEGDGLAETVAAALDTPPTVVRGPASRLRAPAGAAVLDAPASLRAPLRAADAVIATGGQTSLEAAACGTPAVLLALDQAQAEQAQRLASAGAALFAATAQEAAQLAHALLADPERRAHMSQAGQRTVDGRGAHRVARRVDALRTRRGAAT
jgi:spore coat polysaccharide biosynthesis predicted glycosyltransferase SpsG